MSYLLDHSKLGFCWLDLIALILLIAAILVVRKKLKKMKEEKEKLEDELAKLNAGTAIDNNAPFESVEQNAPNVPEEGAYGS